ncbi:hypothetical protein M569_06582, partial [Genlisea aurea]
MKLAVKNRRKIRPAAPTFQGIMPLTEMDLIGVVDHVSLIYFYPSHPQDAFAVIAESLQKVLVYFYPLAGRLRRLFGGRMEIVCNGEGAVLIEAACDDVEDIDVLYDFAKSGDCQNLVPQVDYSGEIDDIPLLLVQLTAFRRGGVSVGLSFSHAVVDGKSVGHFLSEWSRIARGEPIGELPFLGREITIAGDAKPLSSFPPAPLIIGETDGRKEREKETTLTQLKITKSQIEALKKEANRTAGDKPCGRYKAIAAHVWRSACRARSHEDNQPTWMCIYVDVRKRVSPNLPDNYFGNAVVPAIAESFSGELVKKPLGFTVDKIREAIDGVTSEFVHSAVRFIRNLDDLSPFQFMQHRKSRDLEFYGNPNVTVTSGLGSPKNGLDFGWGKEVLMIPFADNFYCDGESFVFEDGGDVAVFICLQSEVVEEFRRIFYEDL